MSPHEGARERGLRSTNATQRSARFLASAALAAALGGCASGPPQRVVLGEPGPAPSTFQYLDARAIESRSSAAPGGGVLLLGDDRLEPSIADRFGTSLQSELGAELRGKTLKLTAGTVRVWRSSSAQNPTATIVSGLAFGFVGILVAQGIEATNTEHQVEVEIDGDVDGRPFAGRGRGEYRGTDGETVVREAVTAAIANATAAIRLLVPLPSTH